MSPQTNGVLGATAHPQPNLEAIELIPFTGPSVTPHPVRLCQQLLVACRALLTTVSCARSVRGISSPQSPAATGMHTGRTSRLYSDQATRCVTCQHRPGIKPRPHAWEPFVLTTRLPRQEYPFIYRMEFPVQYLMIWVVEKQKLY